MATKTDSLRPISEARLPFALGSVFAVAAVLLLLGADSTPLFDPDESRFARTSVEMLRNGDLVVPSFEGRPRLVKPPLLHWMQAALFGAFGVREGLARLPSIGATLGSMLLLTWLARRRFGPEGAVWVALVFLSFPLVVIVGRLGTLDALLSLHVLAVVVLDLGGPGDRPGYAAAATGGLIGLALLIKGPVGVILPVLLILAGRTAARRELLSSWRSPVLGILAATAVVLPWGLAFLRRVGGSTVGDTLREQVLERYFVGNDHVSPAWFLVAVMFVGFLPWGAALIAGLIRAGSRWRDPAAGTALYAAAGLVAGLVFFSLGKSKLPTYILPLAPLVALVIAWELGQEVRRARGSRLVTWLLTSSCFALAAGLAWAGLFRLEEGPKLVALLGAAIFAGGALASMPGAWRGRPRWVYGTVAATGLTFLLVAVIVLPTDLSRRRSAAPLIESVPALAGPTPVAVVDMNLPSLTFYLDRVPEKIGLGQLEARLQPGEELLLVFDERDLARAQPAAMMRLTEIGRQGKYVVFRHGD
jgi:4-amino-4-deoxy-L-arabinose transferase-like glycosyltransferase